jgi:1-acyl-sn-glycerol-3-phosphate acyltransferase
MTRINPFRRPWRLLRLAEHLLSGALILATLRALPRSRQRLAAITQWWERRACQILHLTVSYQGKPASGPVLVVANHVSWLDIPVIGGILPVSFLSKAEVRDWPLIGWMSQVAGTLFIERGNHQSRLITDAIHGHIEQGGNVLFFPEGTTSDGNEVRRFHPRLFAAAQNSGAPIQPVAIRYRPAAGGEPVAAFIGDERFLPHLLRVLAEPEILVEVHFCPPLPGSGSDRKTLAATTREAIRTALAV